MYSGFQHNCTWHWLHWTGRHMKPAPPCGIEHYADKLHSSLNGTMHKTLHWKCTKYWQQQMSKRTNVHWTGIFDCRNYCSRDCMKLVKKYCYCPICCYCSGRTESVWNWAKVREGSQRLHWNVTFALSSKLIGKHPSGNSSGPEIGPRYAWDRFRNLEFDWKDNGTFWKRLENIKEDKHWKILTSKLIGKFNWTRFKRWKPCFWHIFLETHMFQ